MNAILLNGARLVNQILVNHGHKGNVVARGEDEKDLVKGLDVIRPIVRRQRDAGQQDPDVGCFKGSENLVEIVACLIERQAAKPVVATEFDDDHIGMKAQDGRKTDDGVLGCGSAGTLIDDLVVVSLGVELALQSIWKGLAWSEAMTGRDAVAKADQDSRRGSQKKARQDQQAD